MQKIYIIMYLKIEETLLGPFLVGFIAKTCFQNIIGMYRILTLLFHKVVVA
jgi:hypothetical protein